MLSSVNQYVLPRVVFTTSVYHSQFSSRNTDLVVISPIYHFNDSVVLVLSLTVYIIYISIFLVDYLPFCFNQHQNLQVEIKWNVFIFFFHLKNFSSLLCSTLSSSSLSSRHESSHRSCSIEKAVLKNSQHSQENTCVGATF